MSEEIREHDQPQTDEFVEEPLTHDDKQKSLEDSDEETDRDAFEFQVSEPRRTTSQSSKLSFMVYKISGSTTLREYEKKSFSVDRRFNHFVWLRARLVENYPGVIVPPIPEKSVLGTLDKIVGIDTSTLLAYRQRALLKFLTRVGEHPLLQKSPHLKTFLTMPDRDFEKVTAQKVSSQQGSGLGYIFRSSISKEADWITAKKKFISHLEEALKYLKLKLQTTSRIRKDMISTMTEFGKSFKQMGQIETSYQESELSKILVQVSDQMNKLSTVAQQQSDKETMQVIETITYYLGMCESIKQCAKQIENLRIKRDDFTILLRNETNQLEKLKLKPNTELKVAQLEQSIEITKKKEAEANDKLQKAEKNFEIDLERFDEERCVDFKYMLDSFINLQIDYCQNVATVWESMIPTVASIAD